MKKIVKLSNVMSKLDASYAEEIKKAVEAEGKNVDDLEVFRKDWATETKAQLEEGSRTAIKYVSTRTVDQSGDVIVPKGVTFKQFKKTGMPVFYNHNYSMPQIGRDEWIKSDDWGVKVKQVYADTGEGTLSNILWKLTQQDMNKQSSVGIIPLEMIKERDPEFKPAIKELAKEWPEFKSTQKACNRIITKALLFEHSDVSMACNTDTDVLAVSKMFSDAGADEKLLKQLGLPLLGIVKEEEEEVDKFDLNEGDIEADESPDLDSDDEVIEIDVDNMQVVKVTKDEIKIEKPEKKPEKKKVTMVKAPRFIKLISGPTVSQEEVDEMVKAEIRKKLGRLI